ncbi:MAG: hypothetical protein AB7U75_14890 [Hyphomicrobiaceae bacterium]
MIVGNYVKKFSDANYAMPEGMSMNAPYKFHWLRVESSDGRSATCYGGDEKMVLLIRKDKKKRMEYVKMTVQDPIFGPQNFKAYPFQGVSS